MTAREDIMNCPNSPKLEVREKTGIRFQDLKAETGFYFI